MLRTCVISGALILWASCGKSDGSDSIGNALLAGSPEAGAGSSGSGGKADGSAGSGAVKAGSGAAGSAAVALAGSAAGSAAKPDAAKAGSGAMVGSAAGSAAKPGDAARPVDAKAGSGAAMVGSAAGSAAKPGDAARPVDAKAGSGAAMAGSAAVATKPEAARPVDAKAGSGAAMAGSAAVATKPEPAKPTIAPVTVKPPTAKPSELAAIKLSLLPNWDRDIDGPGTFQYVVRIKGTQSTKTFTFHYGYDEQAAPSDRDQYKKYLQDSNLLTGEIRDRQRGSAWFLEGKDAAGLPAFRYQVLYGGKRLICYGSLYKDADANRLGDDRDQTVIQAKQICETLAL